MNWQDRADRILSISGMVVALCAVGVAVYEAHVQAYQARISVWPYIEEYNTSSDDLFARVITNHGLGPAILHSTVIRFDGKPLHDWKEVAHALAGDGADFGQSDIADGTVLLPGRDVRVIEIHNRAGVARAVANRNQLDIEVCYCSLYGECWTAGAQHAGNRVEACPDPGKDGFYSPVAAGGG